MRRKLLTPFLGVLIFVASCNSLPNDFDTDNRDTLVIQLINSVLEQAHYLDKNIDDKFSEKVYQTFLKNLDPYKRYFYSSDLKEFSKYKFSLDDAFKNPNVEFFEFVYNRYNKRILESQDIYKEILSKPFDFTKDEVCECDFENLDYVDSRDEMYDRWRKLLKIYVIENYHDEIKNNEKKEIEDVDFVNKPLNLIEKEIRQTLFESMNESFRFLNEELQRSDWFSVYINSFVSQYDPHTSYLDPESKDRFDVDMSGNYAGIGARLQKKIDKVEITELISGGPAWRDNVKKVQKCI